MLKWSKPCSPKDNSFDFEAELTYTASTPNIDISNDTRFSFEYEPNYAVNNSKSMSDMYASMEGIYLQMQSNRYRSETQNKSHYEYEERSLNEYGLILDSLEELRKWIQLTTKTTLEEINVLNSLDDGLTLNKLLSKIGDNSYKKKINRKISFAWNRRALIFNFLRECKKTFGIKESDLFTVEDWRYVINHPECYFQDEIWMYNIRKVLKTFYQLVVKSKRKVQTHSKEVNLDVFRQLFLIEDLADVTMCSEFSRNDTIKSSPVNCDETETPQPITFRSYIKPKEKIEILNKLQRLKKQEKNNSRNKRCYGQTRSSTPHLSPTAPESPNTVSDDGYATSSGTCGSPFLQFPQKKSKGTLSIIDRITNKQNITKEKTDFGRVSKTDKPFNTLEEQKMCDFVKPISKPSEEEINTLNRFLNEFTNEKRENNQAQNKLEVKNEPKKEYFQSKNSPHQKAIYQRAEINWIQSSVKETLNYVQLTAELKNVVNDLLTVGNTYNSRKNGYLLPKEDLENFFKTITIPETLSSVSEYSTSEEYSSTDEYIPGEMPALLKEGNHEKKPQKEEKRKKHRSSTDKNTKNKLHDDNPITVQNGGNHYESIVSPKSPDRISRSETRKSRKHKHDKSNKKKSPKHEKSLEVVESPRTEKNEQLYETISNKKNHDESLPANDQKYNKFDSKPQEDSTITAGNLVAAKSKLKPPKYLNPPNDAPLKRNNSIHIKEPEYTWDTADGRHRVYLRSKEGVTSAPPNRNDLLNNHDENFKGWLRNNIAQDNIHERLGVSPDIVELLREEENFWQKQQVLKKWRESHDKQINNFKPTLPPARTRPNSTYARINACPVSESEREIEEARIEREANRLMYFRAQQVHVLETSKENLFRDDEKKTVVQPYHSSILSSSHVNTHNLKQRSSVHFSTNNKPVYERSNLVRNTRRARTTTCFSDDDEIFNDYRRDSSVHNRGYFSDHDAFLESSTFQAGPKQTGNKFRIRCTSCSRTINDERLISIEGQDFNWHIKCFFCVVCRAYLNDKHIVRVRIVDSRLHCRFCYSARNGELMSEV